MRTQTLIPIIVVVLIVFVMSCQVPSVPETKERIKISDWACYDLQFPSRAGHIVLAFSNYKYIIGGTADSVVGMNDVWKESIHQHDNWVTATASAEFSPRWDHTGVVFGQKMWVIGGTPDGVSGLNDVWYSEDGAVWVTATASAAFSGRWGHTSVEYDNKMWVIGGTADGVSGLNDVWYSEDGEVWVVATASAAFSGRWEHTSTVFKDKIWMIGGTPDGVSGLNDVWYSEDGAVWVTATASAAFSGRWGHQSGIDVEKIDDYIFVIGGRDQSNYLNDIWSSKNGKDWIKQNSTNLMPRARLGVVHRNVYIQIYGGRDESNYYGDSCYSVIEREYY